MAEQLDSFLRNLGSTCKYITHLTLAISTQQYILSNLLATASNKDGEIQVVTSTSIAFDHQEFEELTPNLLQEVISPSTDAVSKGPKVPASEIGKSSASKRKPKKPKPKRTRKQSSTRSRSTVPAKPKRGTGPPSAKFQTLDSEGVDIAALLTKHCPNVKVLTIGKGVRCAALAVFGLECKNLVKLELSHLDLSGKELEAVISQKKLPKLTCINMIATDMTNHVDDDQACVRTFKILCTCPTLTHFTAADGVLEYSPDWWILPSDQLIELSLCEFPGKDMPVGLQLPKLLSMTVRSSVLTCTQVKFILEMAPNLTELSGDHELDMEDCTIEISDLCTDTSIQGWTLLYQRVCVGLFLHDLHIFLNPCNDDEPGSLLINEVLWELRALPIYCFSTGILTNDSWCNYPDYISALRLIGTVFPALETLELRGRWTDEDMSGLRTQPALQRLIWCDMLKPTSATLHFLEVLEHGAHIQSIEFLSSLGPDPEPTWESYEMQDELSPPSRGFQVLPYDVHKYLIWRTPSDRSVPIRELRYERKPAPT